MPEDEIQHLVSPHYGPEVISPGGFDDWLLVWEDRLWGWWLEPAHQLKDNPHAVYVVLQIVVTVLETMEIYHRGRDSDGATDEFFRGVFLRFFGQRGPNPVIRAEDAAHAIYKAVRCGLSHSAMTYGEVFLTLADSVPIIQCLPDDSSGGVDQIYINPAKLLDGLTTQFRRYVEFLRNGRGPQADKLRRQFERAWHTMQAKTRAPIPRAPTPKGHITRERPPQSAPPQAPDDTPRDSGGDAR